MSGNVIELNSLSVIPNVGLGCYDIPISRTAEIVHEACKVGYGLFDTAVLYGNEKEVGNGILAWLEKDPSNKREDIFYTTKLWNTQCGYANAKSAIIDCLNKVEGLKYIDLLLIHSPLCGPNDRLTTWKACQEAVEEGLVKNIGVSNYGQLHLEQLLGWEGLTIAPCVNQLEISPWCMRLELAHWCTQQGIVVEAYAPLTHGYKLTSPSVEIQPVLEHHKIDMAQLLIKWSMQKGYIPLPKTSTCSRLKSNISLDFELSPEEMAIIDQPNAYEPTDWECTDAS